MLSAIKDRNPMMLKHLGINYLGQRDRMEVHQTVTETIEVQEYSLPNNGRGHKIEADAEDAEILPDDEMADQPEDSSGA